MDPTNFQDSSNMTMTNDSSSPHVALKHKILLIEDDEEMRHLLYEELNEAGYHLMQAKNGTEAFKQLESNKPALVVSDLHVPGGGLDFLFELRKKCGFCPIIVITAMRDDRTKHEVEQQGIDAFLGKPVRMTELLGNIQRLLST